MSILVTDKGFAADDFDGSFAALADIDAMPGASAVILENTDDPMRLSNRLADLALIRVNFPSFSDGRGFTVARRLRMMGYKGRLRAYGHLIADQYAMARRVGFDEVEISDELAARQPEDQWQYRADWRAHDYLTRLRG